MAQCIAKSKQSGQQCKRSASPGYQVCAIHGGRTSRGIASPHFKTGRHSKALPERLAARYAESSNDDELLGLRDEIALTDALIEDTIAKLDTGGSKAHFVALGQKWTEYQRLKRSHKDLEADAALFEVGDLITEGLRDFTVLDDLARLIEQRRKLTESERKRLVDMQNMITAEEAILFVSALQEAVRRNVSDRNTLGAIGREFARLVGQPGY